MAGRVNTWRQPSALPLPWAQRWTPVPGRWHRSCHGSELLPGPVRSSEPGGGSPVLAGSWAVASPLQLSGREVGSCFTDFSGDLCCRAGRAPGTCGAAAPVTRRGRRCPGRRWLRDTKLFARQALPCTLFHTFCRRCCPSPCGTAELGRKGALWVQSDRDRTPSPGCPFSAAGVAASAGRAGAALLLCWLRYSEINAGYWEFLSPQCFPSAPETSFSSDLLPGR